MRILLFSLLFICCRVSAQVIITGAARFANATEKITVSRPVGPFASYKLTTDTGSNTTLRQGRYVVRVPLTQPSFVNVYSKTLGDVSLLAFPGDHFQVIYNGENDSLHHAVVRIQGPNAAGQLLYRNGALLNAGPVSEKELIRLIQAAKTTDEAYQALLGRLAQSTAQVQQLADRKLISPAFARIMTSEAEQQLLFWNLGFLTGWTKNSKVRQQAPLRLDSIQVIQLTTRLLQRFYPFNARYDQSNLLELNGEMTCIAIADGLLPNPNANAAEKWQPFDPEMKQVSDAFAVLAYAPTKYAQKMIATTLLIAKHFHVGTPVILGAAAALYLRTYPASPYNSLIRKRMTEDIAGFQLRNDGKTSSLAQYHEGVGFSYTELPGADTLRDLKTFVKTHFPGQPVFIDCWATFCGPCREQFRFEGGLREFLEKKHIAMLYISVDKPVMVQEWRQMIEENKLIGTHYLANKLFQDQLNQIFTGIPRYLLFNAKGEMVGGDMLRPESGDKLYTQIAEKLGIK